MTPAMLKDFKSKGTTTFWLIGAGSFLFLMLFVVAGLAQRPGFLSSGRVSPGALLAQIAPSSGLVGYWSFDAGSGSTTADGSGNSNTGTLVGGASWATGRQGTAASFNGNEQAVSIPDSASIQTINSSRDITVSMWVRRSGDNAANPNHEALLYKGPWGANDDLATAFGIYANAGGSHQLAAQIGTHRYYMGGPALNDASWHHIVLIVNGTSNSINAYTDGTLTGWDTTISDINLDSNPILLADVSDRSYDFNGLIDELRIYNRALSAQEVSDIYNSTGSGTPPPPPATCSSFTYSAYGACESNSTQTRTVTASSPAGCTGGSPVLSQSCTYTPPPAPTTCSSFTYSGWGSCQSNTTQTRTVQTSSPSGCTGGSPVTSQSCVYTAPAPPTSDTMTAATRTSGVAPLLVVFDAVNLASQGWSSNVVQPTDGDYASLHYEWNFGDTNAGTWSVSGVSKNTDTGYIASHVYETPGTYAATLTVTTPDDRVRTYTQTITVSAFSGTTYYVASNGNDSNVGTDINNPLRTFDAGISKSAANVRILFRRGDTFTTAGAQIRSSGPGIVGAYGSGAVPIISGGGLVTGAQNVVIDDWRIMDLNFIGPGRTVDQGSGFSIAYNSRLNNTLLLRVEVSEFRVGIGWNDAPANTPHNAIGIIDSSVHDVEINGIFIGGRHLAVMGTSIQQVATSHDLRVWQGVKSVLSHNFLNVPGPTRHNIKLHGYGEADVATGRLRTEYIIIGSNTIVGNQLWSTGLGPQDNGTNERVSNVIFERNRSSQANIHVMVWARDVTIRNNLFTQTTDQDGIFVHVGRRGIELAPDNVRIYNNTAYTVSTASRGNNIAFAEVLPEATNVTVQNNIISAPFAARLPLIVEVPSPYSTNSGINNFIAGSADFRNAAAGDFRLAAGSTAVGIANPLSAVREDFTGATRSSAPNLGAFDSGSGTLPTQTTCSSFTYSNWGSCQTNNTQSRTVTGSSPASCIDGTPVLSQSCTYVAPVAGTMTTATRVSGVAPLLVVFDPINTPGGFALAPAWASGVLQPSDADYSTFNYAWNFGDPGSGNWTVGSGRTSKNTDAGMISAHVYENPGTYIATLTLTDASGQVHVYTQPIVVSAFSGTTYYVASNGNDSNTGTDINAPLRTFNAGIAKATTNTRILFRRGDTFTTTGGQYIPAAGPGIVGAYGSGAKPIVQETTAIIDAILTPTGGDWRVMDIDFRGTTIGTQTTWAGVGLGGAYRHPGRNTVLLRLDISETVLGAGSGDVDGTTEPNTGSAVVESDIYNVNDNGLFLGGYHLAILGTTVRQTGRSHDIRMWTGIKSTIAHNFLDEPGGARLAIKLHTNYTNDGVDPNHHSIPDGYPGTQFVQISDNEIRGNTVWGTAIGPASSYGVDDMRITDVIYERNHSSGNSVEVLVWARKITIRNNIFVGASDSDGTPIRVERHDIEPAPDDIKIYNNTAYLASNSSHSSPVSFVQVMPEATNVYVRNNVLSAPFVRNSSFLSMYDIYGVYPTVSENNLILGLSDFINAQAGDYHLASGSAGIGASIPLSSVREDFERQTRTSASNVGAFGPGSGSVFTAPSASTPQSPQQPAPSSPEVFPTPEPPLEQQPAPSVSEPSPEPSVLALACTLQSATWLDERNNTITGAYDNDPVRLQLTGSAECLNQTVTFNIEEVDALANDAVQSLTATFTDVTIQIPWTAQYIPDGVGNPEFQFQAVLVDGDRRTSGQLEVFIRSSSSGGGGGGGGKRKPATPHSPLVTVPAVSLSPITKPLRAGMTDSDVLTLQKFLNANGFIIAVSGVGSKGNETMYFGNLTQQAVQAFQRAKGIASSGTPDTTGYGRVGPRTMAAINALLGTVPVTSVSTPLASPQPVVCLTPHFGYKNGICLPSCGVLGGTASFADACSNHGMSDVGKAYDVIYCCKR